MSKVTAEGMTVRGEVLMRLAEELLPSAFGGWPADYQFLEERSDGQSRLCLRVDPRVRGLDEQAVVAYVRRELRETTPGFLAEAVWHDVETLRLARLSPRPTRSGKALPLDVVETR